MDKLRFVYKFGRFRVSIVGVFLSVFGGISILFGTVKTLLVSVIFCLVGLFLIAINNHEEGDA